MQLRLSIFFMILLNLSFGQQKHELRVSSSDKSETFFVKGFAYKTQWKDSSAANKAAKELLNKIQSGGYLAASIDSLIADSARTHIYMYIGERLEDVILQNGNVDVSLLSSSGVKNTLNNGKKIKVPFIELIKEKLIRTCENTGYPFASIRLDSLRNNGNSFEAKLFLQKNELIRFDSIHIFGKTKVKRAFLKNYLGIKLNRPYNEANIQRISQRISELPFAEAIQPATVLISNGKAVVNLYLKDKKASQFDAVLGLLPGSSGQKVLITGEARIHLVSPFGMGEELYLEWKKLQPKTQELDVRVSYPYLVGLPLGISARFQFYKRDTSYLTLDGDYGIQYQIIGSNYLKASLKQHNTIVTNIDTAYIQQTRRLPKILDIATNEFALEYFLQKLNYRFNPVSGYTLRFGGSAGEKRIKKNNNIVGLKDELTTNGTFAFLYDTTRLKSFQFKLSFAVEKYWKLAARHTIKTSFEGKYFFAPTVFENEKYRLGGVNSLRGFDDQSIFTPYYAMGNVEYRFLLSKNSYFGAFFNAAVVEDTRAGKGPVDFPFGFGAGAALETKIGIFGITYAMGRQLDNKINFNSSKIHIGYVNYF